MNLATKLEIKSQLLNHIIFMEQRVYDLSESGGDTTDLENDIKITRSLIDSINKDVQKNENKIKKK